MQASAGQSISDKLTEQMAAEEAQCEFIFYLFFQKVVLFSFLIFLKNNYVFDTFLKKAVPLFICTWYLKNRV